MTGDSSPYPHWCDFVYMLYIRHCGKLVECCCVLTTPQVCGYYSTFVIKFPCCIALWHSAVIEFATLTLGPFLHAVSAVSLNFKVMICAWIRAILRYLYAFLWRSSSLWTLMLCVSDIAPSGEIYVHSSLQADFTVISDRCILYSVEAPTMAAGVFKLSLQSLSILGNQRELLTRMDQGHNCMRLSEAHIQSLEGQISTHTSELDSVRSQVRQHLRDE